MCVCVCVCVANTVEGGSVLFSRNERSPNYVFFSRTPYLGTVTSNYEEKRHPFCVNLDLYSIVLV